MRQRDIQTFRKKVYEEYATLKRDLPWRRTKDPYRILVSELMLQQTQVERVIPKYDEFLKKFPTIVALSEASLKDVLAVWQGLGYNRRAKMLHECAKIVCVNGNGKIPKSYEELKSLPGVGPYTAGAVMVFARNEPIAIIETNIRSVYLHHFFRGKQDISDRDIMVLVKKTLDKNDPGKWYGALMDYGAKLKKTAGNPNSRSKHYTKQSRFEDSDRQVRGEIIRELLQHGSVTTHVLSELIGRDTGRVHTQLTRLSAEGLISPAGDRWTVTQA